MEVNCYGFSVGSAYDGISNIHVALDYFALSCGKLHLFVGTPRPKVAVIREEGSNGDREMVSAFYMAGFEVWDVNVQDLCSERITLDQFRGIVFVGGFSYADVMGSAKGEEVNMSRYRQNFIFTLNLLFLSYNRQLVVDVILFYEFVFSRLGCYSPLQ